MGFGRRIALAFRAFFALLRHGTLPAEIVAATAEQPAAADAAPPVVTAAAPVERPEDGAVLMLAVLQREGRLVDFLMEDLGGYSDAQIGAAVRDVHANCRRALETALDVEPILDGAEDQAVSVPAGFDPASIKLVGRVVGSRSVHGHAAAPRLALVAGPTAGARRAGHGRQIVAPAEVEIS